MSLIGKGASSLRKKDVMEQKSIALGFKKMVFAHKANAGETGINITALVTPTEMSTLGFVNPSVADLSRTNIFQNKNNLKIVSSLSGILIPYLSYTVNSATQITFNGFTAAQDEIFTCYLDEAPTTSLSVVDGQNIVASGILLAGETDFNIGMPIPINQNDSTQIGAVMVFADRGLQYRKVGNQASGDGDYIEVPVAGGLGSLIRFNASGADRFITVVSNGVVAERPDGSMTALIERVQGQVDQMVPTLAALAGVPETTFQTAPNSVDLKQFGDKVLTTESLLNQILTLEIPIKTPWVNVGPSIVTSTGTSPVKGSIVVDNVWKRRDGTDMVVRYELRMGGGGSAGTGDYLWEIPLAGEDIDENKIYEVNASGLYYGPIVGHGGGSVESDGNAFNLRCYLHDDNKLRLVGDSGPGDYFVGTSGNAFNQAQNLFFEIRVPIKNWAETQTVAQALGL